MWANRCTYLFGCALVLAPVGSTHAIEPTEPALRVARSNDGLSFENTGVVVAPNAWSPGLVQLPNGQLLAIFDHGTQPDQTVLAISRSRDAGTSWSKPQPVRITWPSEKALRCGHGELIVLADGLLRLFFVVGRGHSAPDSANAPGAVVMAASSRDGLNYRIDERVRISIEKAIDPCLSLLTFEQEMHLFVVDENTDLTRQYSSPEGRTFRESSRLPELNHARSIVPIEQGYRAYSSRRDGVMSVVSMNGANWKLEPGVRLAGRWDPAVVQMHSGQFLMIYAPLREPESAPRQLTGTDPGSPSPAGSGQTLIEKRTEAAKHVHRLAVSFHVYAQKHNGQFPPDLETLVEAGLAKPCELVSPLESNPGSPSYIYIDGQMNTMDPRNVIAYEKPDNHGDAGTVVVFLDAHVEWMKPEDLDRSLQETYQRLGR